MKFKRILSLLLVALMLMASFASWAVFGAFAEDVAILTPAAADRVGFNVDSESADNYAASIVGWTGYKQEISAMGYAINDGAITWNGSINRNPEGAVKDLAGPLAVRYSITASLDGLSFGKHTVNYVAKLADGSITLMVAKEVEIKDLSAVGDADYDFDSATTADLSKILTFKVGLSPENCTYKAAPYKMSGINQLTTTATGTYALTIKNLKTPNGHGAIVVRGKPTPDFGDGNYFGHDGNNAEPLSVGCAGIYFGIITENGAPVLRLNVKGNVDGSKAIPHIYKIAMTSYDITVVDDNKAITFYEGGKLLAKVELSGNSKGYATKAVVTANGETTTHDDVCAAATAASDFGFIARSVDVTFDSVKLTSLATFNETFVPAEPETDTPAPLLSVEKTEFVEGEAIMVTSSGTGKDWVAIYEINDVYPDIGSIYWYYPADYAGQAVNIRGICEPGPDQINLGRAPLPAGEYKIILFANDGYAVIEQINITIKAAETEAPETEAPKPEMPAEATNVALGQNIVSTSTYSYGGSQDYIPEKLVDGIWEGVNGWIHDTTNHPTQDTICDFSITITLDKVYTLYQLILKPMDAFSGGGFPSDYEILVSTTGADDSWTTVVTETGKTVASAAEAVTYVLDEAVEAQYIRLHITKTGSGAYLAGDGYYCQLGEIEAWGVAATQPEPPETEFEPSILTPEEAGMVGKALDTTAWDAASANCNGWIGFPTQSICDAGYSINGAEIVWGSKTVVGEGPVLAAGGENAKRFYISAPLAGLEYGDHVVNFYLKLEDGNYVLIHTQNVVLVDPGANWIVDLSKCNIDSPAYMANWPAAGIMKPLFNLGYGHYIALGNVDLSAYKAVKITYSFDGSAPTKTNFESASSHAIGLKSEASSYGQVTDDNFNGDIIHGDMVFDAGGWTAFRVVELDLSDINYNGSVYATMHNPAGTTIAISNIEFIANDPEPEIPEAGSTVTIPEFNSIASAGITDKYVVTGTITEIANETYGNMYIEDAEGNKLYIYGLYDNNGVFSYPELSPKPVVGDTITVIGAAATYDDAPQMKNASLLKIGDTDYAVVLPEYDATIDFADAANRTEFVKGELQVWTMNGITMTNTGNTGDYINPVRIYKGTELTISASNMKEISFYCTGGSKYYIASEGLTTETAGTWTVEGNVATFVLDEAADSVTFVAAANQIRVALIGINEAKAPAIDPEDSIYNDLGDKYYILDETGYAALYEITIDKTAGTLTAGETVYNWTYTTAGGFVFETEGVMLAPSKFGGYVLQLPGAEPAMLVTEIPEEPQIPVLVLGDNTFDVPASGLAVEFFAKVDGTYTFAWAAGEENGEAVIENASGSETLTFPYEITLAAGESVTIILYTLDWNADVIDIVVSAKEPEVPQAPVLVLGDNTFDVPASGLAVEFFAKVDGTYTFAWAAGEENGEAVIENASGSETLTFPYEITLAAGESVTIILYTLDWNADVIDIVVSAKEPEAEVGSLIFGENEVAASFTGIAYTFSAKAAGTYVFNWGEIAGIALVEIDGIFTDTAFPYEVELAERETITIILASETSEIVNVTVSGKEPEAEIGTLIFGENEVAASFTGIKYTFSAKAAGTYVFNWGAIAGTALVEIDGVPTEIAFPYEVELAERQTITIILASETSETVNVTVSGKEPEQPKATELVVGNNSIIVPVEGLTVVLTATKDATYTFAWAAGELNGVATMIDAEGNATEIALPLELTVKAGETVTIVLGTADFAEDTIDLVITEKTGSGDIFDEDDDKGCFGVIGSGSVLAILALLPAAYAVRRRKDEE